MIYLCKEPPDTFADEASLQAYLDEKNYPRATLDVLVRIDGKASKIQPRFAFVPVGGTAPEVKRDKAGDEKMIAKVLEYVRHNSAVTCTAKVLCADCGITGAEFSIAKKALLKAGAVKDPGKGKIAATTATSIP